MKTNLFILVIILSIGILGTSCKKSNGKIYQVKEACRDGGCEGRIGSWYLKNTSYDKTIKYIIQDKEIDDSGKETLDTFDRTLDPGEIEFLGCIERDCKAGWEKVSYKLVGEQIQE